MKNVTFQNNLLTLVGKKIEKGNFASDFRAINANLQEVRLKDIKNPIKVINSFISLDTPTCDLQVKEFNKEATLLSKDVAILGISKDLPFAQKRFCDSFNLKNIYLLSDYKYSSFGINYGILIKELNLLARALFIIDQNNCIRYMEIAKEITKPLNFKEAIKEIDLVLKKPSIKAQLQEKHCTACEGKEISLSHDIIQKNLKNLQGWELIEDKKIVKEFLFKDFVEAKYFLDLLSNLAEEEGHHPTFTLSYKKLKVTLSTHRVLGLSENDFIMASMIDGML